MAGGGEGTRPYRRLTDGERERFLGVLRETGNRKTAAAAIGAEPRLMDQRREHDDALDRGWTEAVEEADRRLREAEAPFGCGDGFGAAGAVRRGKNGRLQIVETGEARWSAAVEARFLAALRESGNVRAAARAVGFSESTVWQRRRAWPGLAQAMEEMLEEAELSLEFRIAAMANGVASGVASGVVGGSGDAAEGFATAEGTVASDCAPGPPPRFDMEQAMRFLKWREEKRRGRGGRAPAAKPPGIEEVTEKIVRQVAAIKRHAEKEAARRAREAEEDQEAEREEVREEGGSGG